VYKVKQFLSTLIQFGTEISPETGDRVQDLVLNLVVRINFSIIPILLMIM
jgi:hypothetical protein